MLQLKVAFSAIIGPLYSSFRRSWAEQGMKYMISSTVKTQAQARFNKNKLKKNNSSTHDTDKVK